MDVSDCNLWYKASLEIRQKTGCSLFDDASLATIRAQMHMKFKKTFLHEPDASFGLVWINCRSIFDTILVGRIDSIKDARLRNGEICLRMMQAVEHQMIKKLDELPRPYPKLTVQAGTFEELESFKSDVNLGRKFARPPGAGAIKDRSLRSPGGTKAIRPTTKRKYGLQARPKRARRGVRAQKVP